MDINSFSIKNSIEEVPELELYFSLNESRLMHYYEPEEGLFVVESPMVIERALMAGYEPKSFVMLDSVSEEMCRRFDSIIGENHIPVYVSDYETIAGLTGVNITRGVLALMRRRKLPEISEVIRGCSRVAVLDDVENPTNVGAMFRSAAALGIEAIILTSASSDPLYRRASRVSVGNVFQMKWTKLSRKVKDKTEYIKKLQEQGFRTAAMALSETAVSIGDSRLKSEEKLAIILGNEGTGLSDDVIKACDYVVKIPMDDNVDSLNVASAGAIAFWEICKGAER